MRNLRKITAAVLAAALVLTSVPAAFAADPATLANADKAVTLRDLGLYSGQNANDPRVGLDSALTTQDSLIFLAKLFGYYDTASALSADNIAESLAKFDDAASISEYAKNVVAYSATNGIISGISDGDKLFVGVKDTVTAARFSTFMLRKMDYEVADFRQSVGILAEIKGSKVDAALTGDLTRDSAIGMMYGALTAEKADGKTVITNIVGDNADLRGRAEALGLIPPTPAPAPTSNNSRPRVIDYPKVESDCFAIADKGLIFIKFSKAMNEEQMLDPDTYQVIIDPSSEPSGDNDPITTFAAITSIAAIDDRTVKIYDEELKNYSSSNNSNSVIKPSVMINPIADLSGYKLYNSNTPYMVENIEPEAVHIEEAQLISKDKIRLVFNKEMGNLNTDDIIINPSTGSISITTVESITANSEGKTEAVLILSKELATDGTDETGTRVDINTVDFPLSESELGGKLNAQLNIELQDKVAPEIVTWDHDSDEETADIPKVLGNFPLDTITIFFSEDIDESMLSPQSFSVTGFHITDIKAPAGTKTVILTVQADSENIPGVITVTQMSEIFDIDINALNPGSTWTFTPPEVT